jgi:hypothetical protein
MATSRGKSSVPRALAILAYIFATVVIAYAAVYTAADRLLDRARALAAAEQQRAMR